MSPARMSQVESALRMVLAFREAHNRRDIAALMQLFSDECVFDDSAPAPDGTIYKGKLALTAYWQRRFQAFPQAELLAEEVFGLGLRCQMRWRYQWQDAQGALLHVRGISVFQVSNGLISEMLSYTKS